MPTSHSASALTHTHHEEAIPRYSKYGCIFRDAKLRWLYGRHAKLAEKIERASGHASPQKRALPPLLILTVQSQSSDQCYFIPAEEGVRVPGGGDADGNAAAEKLPA